MLADGPKIAVKSPAGRTHPASDLVTHGIPTDIYTYAIHLAPLPRTAPHSKIQFIQLTAHNYPDLEQVTNSRLLVLYLNLYLLIMQYRIAYR